MYDSYNYEYTNLELRLQICRNELMFREAGASIGITQSSIFGNFSLIWFWIWKFENGFVDVLTLSNDGSSIQNRVLNVL